jgi:hypothetical protein
MSTLQQPPEGGDNDGFGRSLPTDRLIKGQLAKWNDQKGWHDRDGLPLPTPMFVIGVNTGLQRWRKGQAETKLNKPLPDPEQLNAAIPQSEWELDLSGKLRPPWEFVHAIYMIDLATGTAYTFANSTVGARICFEQLQESVCIMRALRGSRVLPLVKLEQRPMKTSGGLLRSRPHLQIIDWRTPGDDGGGLLPPKPTPPTPQLAGPTPAAPAPAPAAAVPAAPPAPPATATLDATQPVKPVTTAELIADELPWA